MFGGCGDCVGGEFDGRRYCYYFGLFLGGGKFKNIIGISVVYYLCFV